MSVCFVLGDATYQVVEIKPPAGYYYYDSYMEEIVVDQYVDKKKTDKYTQWARIQLTDDLIKLIECPDYVATPTIR